MSTSFLPATKSLPKEMLPLLTKPAMQYIVEEGVQSTINKFFLVTNKDKQAIANHFDAYTDLEAYVKEENKTNLLADVAKTMRLAQFAYIRQSRPLGLGHAVLMARSLILEKEYFGIMLPDDIIINKTPALAQLMAVAHQERASIIAVQEVPRECIPNYGIITIKKQLTPNLFQVSRIIEKPQAKDAPSSLAIIGRYILSSKIFDALEEENGYAINELTLTDGINRMLTGNEKVFAYKIQGTRYDIGNPIGWLKATISLALQDPLYAPAIKDFLKERENLDSFLFNRNKNIVHTI
jgi:UTP--glucose-1-phosphate uridylyltransferase